MLCLRLKKSMALILLSLTLKTLPAGREIRIMVTPEKVSDDEAVIMARDIRKKIEEEMEYPGHIKVMVVREIRAIEYAK